MAERSSLEPIAAGTLLAYLNTDYWVELHPGSAEFPLRIGESCSALSSLKQPGDELKAAVLTAYNPLGLVASDEHNRSAHAALERRLRTCAARVVVAEGRGRSGGWPPEPSWFALGLDFNTACQLGREFRQNAIVYVGSDLAPALVVLRGGQS